MNLTAIALKRFSTNAFVQTAPHRLLPASTRFLRGGIIFFFATLLFIMSGCDKLPRNGKLDGHWQLMERDGVSVKAERTYWSFQLDLMQLKSYTQTPITTVKYSGGVVARFEHRGDSLVLTKGYLMNRDHQQDILIDAAHPADLSGFGITSLPMGYRVALLTDEEMILSSGQRRLVFRKF